MFVLFYDKLFCRESRVVSNHVKFMNNFSGKIFEKFLPNIWTPKYFSKNLWSLKIFGREKSIYRPPGILMNS